ncbi:MAG: tetratricopeptide repeat protein [Leptospiraceae bacterium]|nr:tetratricopeptide repeat protein [Leptospiraceae bacterium]
MEESEQNFSKPRAAWFPFEPYRWLLAPLLVCLVILTFLILEVVNELRINEVSFALRNNENTYDVSSDMLLTRFTMLFQNSQSIQSTESLLQESRMMTVLSEIRELPVEEPSYAFLKNPAVYIINFAAFITLTEPYRISDSFQHEKLLQIAYIFERRREFTAAVAVYSEVLEKFELNSIEAAYVYLHLGFCLALQGKGEKGRDYLRKAIETSPGSGIAQVAFKINNELNRLTEQKTQIDKMKLSAKKGKAYFEIMAYRDAIDTFEKIKPREKNLEILYFLARAKEEAGDTQSAILDYQKLVEQKNRIWSAAANRRLYLLFSFYSRDDSLKAESIANGIKNGDSQFLSQAESITKGLTLNRENELLQEARETLATIADIPEGSVELAKINPENENKLGELQKQLEKIQTVRIEASKKKMLPQEKLNNLSVSQLKTYFKKNTQTLSFIETRSLGNLTGEILQETTEFVEIQTLYGPMKIPRTEIIRSGEVKTAEVIQ